MQKDPSQLQSRHDLLEAKNAAKQPTLLSRSDGRPWNDDTDVNKKTLERKGGDALLWTAAHAEIALS